MSEDKIGRNEAEEITYKYLFPFERIPAGSKILIYGAGELGQAYLDQMQISNYAHVIGFIDRDSKNYQYLSVPVFCPEKINSIEFDYIVLAFRSGDFVADVRRTLKKKGIEEYRVVYSGIREAIQNEKAIEKKILLPRKEYAFDKKRGVAIALRYGSGLGDSIIQKGFFNELTSLVDPVNVDIYSPKADEYLDSFYSDSASYNLGINDGGGLYTRIKTSYDLAISVVGFARIDHANEEVLCKHKEFYTKVIKLREALERIELTSLPFHNCGVFIRRMIFLNKNCYTSFNYTNDFNIKRDKVKVNVDKTGEKGYIKYGIEKYITINYGNGTSTSGNRDIISKQWPAEYFKQFIKLFKKEFSDIKVVQLGDRNAEKIQGVDRYIFGEDIEIVKHVLIHATFHLDSEGGLVHLASVLGTKCIVLFGPTQLEYFGYPQNINIVSSSCKGCYLLYDTAYRCARGMDKPECMYSITPEVVMMHVDAYLHSLTDNGVLSEKS